MTYTFDQSKDEIARLVKHFEINRVAYLASSYKEAQARQEFIDPLFIALNWDVHNQQQTPPDYREVIVEDSLEMPGHEARKAPDYVFRVERERRFFAEAKKPGVDIKMATGPAYQLRRYAWSAKLPLSVLTDFQEWAAYDCRVRPAEGDKSSTARRAYMTYEEYADKWHDIWDVFSREAVLGGSFDQFALGSKGKRGTSEVDAEFLKEIEGWRNLLAHNIALRNPDLTIDELNDAVQRIIDRIIFLRMGEARGTEEYGQLQRITEGEDIYARLLVLSKKADAKYNSGLFDFSKAGDQVTPRLVLDDKPLTAIIADLYYPQSPYEFSVLPPEILGNVYEQFLGKVIRFTAGHQAKVEEKPDVKKAGGIYYTPYYIVNYIVKNTLGKQIDGKSPHQLEDFRVLDMSCGSGSFLLSAYQYLLEHYQSWYSANKPERNRDAVWHHPDGSYRLTIPEKKRILIEHIFGVDIDRQAVEVTKLSLLLKVLENEPQLSYLQERALPNLDNNIKCGNSLIEPEGLPGRMGRDSEELRRINPFDWRQEFPEVMNNGGFDCVIGNPPYRRELDYKELLDEIARSPIGIQYRSPRMDLWYYFVHRGLELLNNNGLLSFIVNAYWISGTGAEKLISALRDTTHVEEIFFLDKLKVFNNVSGQHMIFRVMKMQKDKSPTMVRLVKYEKGKNAESYITGKSKVNTFQKTHSQLFRNGKVDIQPPVGDLLKKIESESQLQTIGIIRQGIAENPSSINKKTNLKYGNRYTVGQGVFALRIDELNKLRLSDEEKILVHPYHDLADLGRYYLAPRPSMFLIYSTRATCPKIEKYPAIYKHLIKFKPIMEARRETKKGSNSWWHLHWPREESLWKSPKIISIQMSERPSFTVSLDKPVYVPFSVNVFLPNETTKEHLFYILGILNSKLLWGWYKHEAKRRGVGLEINGNVLSRSPIRRINFDDRTDLELHDRLVSIVDHMIDLQNRKVAAADAGEQERIQRLIDATDKQIDILVYELFRLSPEEIGLIERDV